MRSRQVSESKRGTLTSGKTGNEFSSSALDICETRDEIWPVLDISYTETVRFRSYAEDWIRPAVLDV